MDKSEKLFSKIRSDLARKLENTWETSDQEVLNIIDELLLEERKKILSFSQAYGRTEKRTVPFSEKNGRAGRAAGR